MPAVQSWIADVCSAVDADAGAAAVVPAVQSAGTAAAPAPAPPRSRLPVRTRRLLADAEQMRLAFGPSALIRIESSDGDPPDFYRVEYQVDGLARGPDGKPVPRDRHLVEIQLTSEYPRVAPRCKVVTPIFHPNIDPTTVCVGDHWAAGERLVDLVVRIGEMIAYQAYNIQSPLDGEAAMWADLHQQQLPTDKRDLRPADEDWEWPAAIPDLPTLSLEETGKEKQHGSESASASARESAPAPVSLLPAALVPQSRPEPEPTLEPPLELVQPPRSVRRPRGLRIGAAVVLLLSVGSSLVLARLLWVTSGQLTAERNKVQQAHRDLAAKHEELAAAQDRADKAVPRAQGAEQRAAADARAAAQARQALAQAQQAAERWRLALIQAQQREAGQRKTAEELRLALKQAQQREAAQRKTAEEVTKLLESVMLGGKTRLGSVQELMALARFATHRRQRFAATARLFVEYLRGHPEWASYVAQAPPFLSDHPAYFAAAAAAMAARGEGDGAALSVEERAKLRMQALTWMREHIAFCEQRAQDRSKRKQVHDHLSYASTDGWFSGVRDGKQLAGFPEPERQEWSQLWADLASLREKCKPSR
jgi:ubiquitin-protein ligase